MISRRSLPVGPYTKGSSFGHGIAPIDEQVHDRAANEGVVERECWELAESFFDLIGRPLLPKAFPELTNRIADDRVEIVSRPAQAGMAARNRGSV